MLILAVATVLVSAALLFLIQPMFARMILPRLGGSPAVWNTALVFYQVALLAGYGYVHVATRWLGVRRQAVLHLALVGLAASFLPIALPRGARPPTMADPIPWVLATLTMAIGLPYFVVSTTGPLIQRWFAAAATARPEIRTSSTRPATSAASAGCSPIRSCSSRTCASPSRAGCGPGATDCSRSC